MAHRQRKELVPRRQGFVRSQQAWVNDVVPQCQSSTECHRVEPGGASNSLTDEA